MASSIAGMRASASSQRSCRDSLFIEDVFDPRAAIALAHGGIHQLGRRRRVVQRTGAPSAMRRRPPRRTGASPFWTSRFSSSRSETAEAVRMRTARSRRGLLRDGGFQRGKRLLRPAPSPRRAENCTQSEAGAQSASRRQRLPSASPAAAWSFEPFEPHFSSLKSSAETLTGLAAAVMGGRACAPCSFHMFSRTCCSTLSAMSGCSCR